MILRPSWLPPSGRRNIRHITLAIPALLLFVCLLLPYDNAIRQAFRFNISRLLGALGPSSERWVYAPPLFPADLERDVVVVVKTGYGTRPRLTAWFQALSPKSELTDMLIIGDYQSQPGNKLAHNGNDLSVLDMVNRTLTDLALPLSASSYPRITKYENLARAVAAGDEEKALQLSKNFGWELDALKDISGLEVAFEKFPNKKWYILLDDDTYLIQSSLKALLGHLDPQRPYYLGNAVGDFRARFAHGGSSIILSHAAMSRLFHENPASVAAALIESLTAIWGDRLISRALVRIGVFLDERYSHFFSGEAPRFSRIRPDRICSPILSFHGLVTADDILATGERFKSVTKPLRWAQLLDYFGAPPRWRHGVAQSRPGWDHIGNPDVSVTAIQRIATAEGCLHECTNRPRSCMAWTWDLASKECLISPWMTVGEKAEGKVSGIGPQLPGRLEAKCNTDWRPRRSPNRQIS